ncbi:hypothetical protein B2J93_4691 [Marssonina coronariae]|uniref:Uncharacterized protein n=1 Tax=Diplocarpon coronariae TaxID=2795749 RepID=A0A218Z197_9HELO|nr:hypothetical protein B2J93_4691 [Marssonina coronariae]
MKTDLAKTDAGRRHQAGMENSKQLKPRLPILRPKVLASSLNATPRPRNSPRIDKINELIQQMPPMPQLPTLRKNKYKSILRPCKRASAGENMGGKLFREIHSRVYDQRLSDQHLPSFPKYAQSDYTGPRYKDGVLNNRDKYFSRIGQINEMIGEKPATYYKYAWESRQYRSIIALLAKGAESKSVSSNFMDVDKGLEYAERQLWNEHAYGRPFPKSSFNTNSLQPPKAHATASADAKSSPRGSPTTEIPDKSRRVFIAWETALGPLSRYQSRHCKIVQLLSKQPRNIQSRDTVSNWHRANNRPAKKWKNGEDVQDELEKLETEFGKTVAGSEAFPEASACKQPPRSKYPDVDSTFPAHPNTNIPQYPAIDDSMECSEWYRLETASSCDSSGGGAEFDLEDSSSSSSYGDVNSRDFNSDIRSQVSLDDNLSQASAVSDTLSLGLASNASSTEVQDTIADATKKWLLQEIVPEIGDRVELASQEIRQCDLADAITSAKAGHVVVKEERETDTAAAIAELCTRTARPSNLTGSKTKSATYLRAERVVKTEDFIAIKDAPGGRTKKGRTKLSLKEFMTVADFVPARRVSIPKSISPAAQPKAGGPRVKAAITLSKPQVGNIQESQRSVDMWNAEDVPALASPRANHLGAVRSWESQLPATDTGSPRLSQPVQSLGDYASIEAAPRSSDSFQALGVPSGVEICPKTLQAGSDSFHGWSRESGQTSPIVLSKGFNEDGNEEDKYCNCWKSVRPAAWSPTKTPHSAVKILKPDFRPVKSRSPDLAGPQHIASLSRNSLMTGKPSVSSSSARLGDWLTRSSAQPSIKTTPRRQGKPRILSQTCQGQSKTPSPLAYKPLSSEFQPAAGIAAWKTLPDRLALEDKVAARVADLRVRDPNATTPTIKETYKKVVISADTFARTMVEQSVALLDESFDGVEFGQSREARITMILRGSGGSMVLGALGALLTTQCWPY